MTKDLSVKVIDQQGKEAGTVKLDPKIFAIAIKEEIVHQVALAQMANQRQNLAHTKTRSEVRGGGKKPWRQKGTGRARHGSIRSPIWKGGGITFGPRSNRNFSKMVNKKMKTKAVKMVLSDKAENKAISVMTDLKLEKYKTQDLYKILAKFLKKKESLLLILAKADQKVYRSAKNLPKVETILADSLNVVTLLKYDRLVIAKDSLKKISETLGK
ncbi:50S ribosomal protein L4 [Patescibacteria group bacterium]|nr:50S ribosomal protein L4 [Patescibacteria group bacterium]